MVTFTIPDVTATLLLTKQMCTTIVQPFCPKLISNPFGDNRDVGREATVTESYKIHEDLTKDKLATVESNGCENAKNVHHCVDKRLINCCTRSTQLAFVIAEDRGSLTVMKQANNK